MRAQVRTQGQPKAPGHLPMLRLAERARSGAARRCRRGGFGMACQPLPARPPSRRQAGRYCYSIVLDCYLRRAARRTRAKWAFGHEFHCCFVVFNNGRALEDRHTGAVRGRRQVGETNPRCRSATPLASVTSLRSHAAHRPRCDGLRWPRGSRNTWRPEGGCPGSARRCSRW
jgi:hypothetical protein